MGSIWPLFSMLIKVKNNLSEFVGQRVSGSIIIVNLYDEQNTIYRHLKFYTLDIPICEIVETHGAYELEDSIINGQVLEIDKEYYIGDYSEVYQETKIDREIKELLNEKKELARKVEALKEDWVSNYLTHIPQEYIFMSTREKYAHSELLKSIGLVNKSQSECDTKDLGIRYNKLTNLPIPKPLKKSIKLELVTNYRDKSLDFETIIKRYKPKLTKGKGFGG